MQHIQLQVAWFGRPLVKCTWELASSLPQDLVAEYEEVISREVQKTAVKAGGQTIYTLTVTKGMFNSLPLSKRSKLDISHLTSTSSGQDITVWNCDIQEQ